MLLVGTVRSLWDLDRSYALAEDVSVTAMAERGGRAWALFDRERVELVDGFDVEPEAMLEPADGQSLAVLQDGSLLVGRAGARLAVTGIGSAPLRPLDSFESVPGRADWYNPANPTPDLRSLAVGESGRIFANVHVGGVWVSDDGGTGWKCVIERDADVHQVVSGGGGRVGVAAAGGFGWSEDGGEHWSWTTAGLHANYCRAVALDSSGAYVSASGGPGSDQAAVYRAERAGDAFVRCGGGLPEFFGANVDTGQLAVREGRVVIGTDTGDVWESSGGGKFERVSSRLGRVTSIVFT